MGVMTSSGMAFALLAESHGSVEKSRAGVTRLKLFEMYLVAAKRYRVVREGLSPGFTLVEVLVAIALIGLVFSSILSAYIMANDRAEWSTYSLAAQSVALQGIEQVRAARWDPQNWPIVDELGTTNFTQVEKLDVPMGGGAVYCTNYISISTISTWPQLRELRADCVWVLASRRAQNRGPFTNTAVSLRSPDQ